MNISTLSQAYNPNKWATVPYNNLKHIYLSDQRPNFKWPNAENIQAQVNREKRNLYCILLLLWVSFGIIIIVMALGLFGIPQ